MSPVDEELARNEPHPLLGDYLQRLERGEIPITQDVVTTLEEALNNEQRKVRNNALRGLQYVLATEPALFTPAIVDNICSFVREDTRAVFWILCLLPKGRRDLVSGLVFRTLTQNVEWGKFPDRLFISAMGDIASSVPEHDRSAAMWLIGELRERCIGRQDRRERVAQVLGKSIKCNNRLDYLIPEAWGVLGPNIVNPLRPFSDNGALGFFMAGYLDKGVSSDFSWDDGFLGRRMKEPFNWWKVEEAESARPDTTVFAEDIQTVRKRLYVETLKLGNQMVAVCADISTGELLTNNDRLLPYAEELLDLYAKTFQTRWGVALEEAKECLRQRADWIGLARQLVFHMSRNRYAPFEAPQGDLKALPLELLYGEGVRLAADFRSPGDDKRAFQVLCSEDGPPPPTSYHPLTEFFRASWAVFVSSTINIGLFDFDLGKGDMVTGPFHQLPCGCRHHPLSEKDGCPDPALHDASYAAFLASGARLAADGGKAGEVQEKASRALLGDAGADHQTVSDRVRSLSFGDLLKDCKDGTYTLFLNAPGSQIESVSFWENFPDRNQHHHTRISVKKEGASILFIDCSGNHEALYRHALAGNETIDWKKTGEENNDLWEKIFDAALREVFREACQEVRQSFAAKGKNGGSTAIFYEMLKDTRWINRFKKFPLLEGFPLNGWLDVELVMPASAAQDVNPFLRLTRDTPTESGSTVIGFRFHRSAFGLISFYPRGIHVPHAPSAKHDVITMGSALGKNSFDWFQVWTKEESFAFEMARLVLEDGLMHATFGATRANGGWERSVPRQKFLQQVRADLLKTLETDPFFKACPDGHSLSLQMYGRLGNTLRGFALKPPSCEEPCRSGHFNVLFTVTKRTQGWEIDAADQGRRSSNTWHVARTLQKSDDSLDPLHDPDAGRPFSSGTVGPDDVIAIGSGRGGYRTPCPNSS